MSEKYLPMPGLADWANRQLGVEHGLPVAELRRQMLAKVAANDWLPPRSWGPALTVLTRPGVALSGAAQAIAWTEESERWSAEVESFAERLFTLPFDERRERWQALSRSCNFSPALMRRLSVLETLLHVHADCGADASHECRRLADDLATALIKPSNERRQEYHSLVERWNADAEASTPAIGELRSRNPDLAEAAARIFLHAPKSKVKDQASSSFSAVFSGPAAVDTMSSQVAAAPTAPWLQQDQAKPADNKRNTASVVSVVALVVIGLMRLAATNVSRESKPRSDYRPSYPSDTSKQFQNLPATWSELEKERHRKLLDEVLQPDPKKLQRKRYGNLSESETQDLKRKVDEILKQRDRRFPEKSGLPNPWPSGGEPPKPGEPKRSLTNPSIPPNK